MVACSQYCGAVKDGYRNFDKDLFQSEVIADLMTNQNQSFFFFCTDGEGLIEPTLPLFSYPKTLKNVGFALGGNL